MKKWIKSITVVAIICTGFTTWAQNELSLLWKIEGNGLEKPSYLFGTIHMICEDDYIMTPAIEHSLQDAEAFYAEIDFSNQEEMMVMQTAMMTDEPLSERIDAKTYQEFKNLLAEPLDIEIDALENLSDAAIVSMIAMKSFPCTDLKMYEIELLQSAMKGGKKMGGLETIMQQMELMNRTMNTETILKILREFKEKRFEPTERLVTLYKEQQIDGLLHLMRESSYMDAATYHEMLTRRNHEWVEKIPEIMQRHATFFAVGAGHLGGEDGVLQLLRTRGYEITPVDIN